MGESVDFLEYLEDEFKVEEADLRTYSPLVLAYIGDAVYDLIIRTAVVKAGNCPVNKLHRKVSGVVKAPAQAELIERILPLLKEDELQIYKRGKNAKPHTRAKNATIIEYSKATGMEAVLGYLYLKKEMDRLMELVRVGLNGDIK